jgi:hypothetical protein
MVGLEKREVRFSVQLSDKEFSQTKRKEIIHQNPQTHASVNNHFINGYQFIYQLLLAKRE